MVFVYAAVSLAKALPTIIKSSGDSVVLRTSFFESTNKTIILITKKEFYIKLQINKNEVFLEKLFKIKKGATNKKGRIFVHFVPEIHNTNKRKVHEWTVKEPKKTDVFYRTHFTVNDVGINIDSFELSVLNLNSGEKAIHYREKAMTEITTSQETLNVLKTALSKHANPVPCDLCGKLMKNIKAVKLHMAKKHKN
ncbi:hypothetical protein BpHYR1_043000 [Brachionus plicatilis]|uniref:C2H2-type domain-containing protein n=1 Tax=Brachionus plicatilis TaxID=10195 RepID=A0A3M7SLZ6_BRAPC|nr:hypothetical protein BpHYR1_043000 [Brachionus plicatilis]